MMRFESKIIQVLVIAAAVVVMSALTGCSGSSGEQADSGSAGGGKVVTEGDTVTMNYKGTLDDGTVFSESDSSHPFKFVAGTGQVIPGFDKEVLGMKLHETKTFTLPDSMAYGPRHEEAVRKVPRSFFPDNMNPQVGQQIQLSDNQGRPFPAKIVAMDADSVTLDMNHELAGKNLTFEIEIVGIN